MSMRIVWASPWGERSSIAAFGARVVAELLSRGHVVDVVRTERGWGARSRPRATAAAVRPWNAAAVRELVRNSDTFIVNLSHDYPSCGAMLADYQALGALGIVHDPTLRSLTAGWARTLPNRRAVLEAIGDADAWCAAGLAGALVHRPENLAVIEAACAGPVHFVPQPPDPQSGGSFESYVDTLLRLVNDVIARRPAIMAGVEIGRILSSFGLAPDAQELDELSARIQSLLSPS